MQAANSLGLYTLPMDEAQARFLKDLCEWVDKYEKEHYTEMKVTDVYAVAGREVKEDQKIRK